MRAPWEPFFGHWWQGHGIVRDPATIAIVAVGASAVSAAGAVYGGIQASNADNYNAEIATQNASSATAQANLAADQQSRAAMLLSGSTKAAYGAAGVTNEGSPIDVLASSANKAELDRQTILYKGALQAQGYNDEASLDQAKAGNAVTSGILSGIGTAAGGASKYFAMTTPSPGGNLSAGSGGSDNLA